MFDDLFDGGTVPEARELTFGSISLRLMCVSRENQLIDRFVPLVVWHAAETACKALAGEHAAFVRGKSVIELGSGTGLTGLVAAKVSGQRCLLTDGETSSVDCIEDSIALNNLGNTVSTAVLQWGDVPAAQALIAPHGPFQVAIATDVIYSQDAVVPLLTTANCVIEKAGFFYLFNHKFRFPRLEDTIVEALNSEALRPDLCLIKTLQLDDIHLFIIQKLL